MENYQHDFIEAPAEDFDKEISSRNITYRIEATDSTLTRVLYTNEFGKTIDEEGLNLPFEYSFHKSFNPASAISLRAYNYGGDDLQLTILVDGEVVSGRKYFGENFVSGDLIYFFL
ncbi:MAG: hypothetical protein R3E32_06510 [Chitinophagales bacterium]